jgi:hypothetical protein
MGLHFGALELGYDRVERFRSQPKNRAGRADEYEPA